MSDHREHIEMLPEHMHRAVLGWVEHGKPPGDFLRNVIQNNLFGACGRADPVNLAALPDYITYFYNYTPSECWGSEVDFENWRKAGGLVGKGLMLPAEAVEA